MVNKAIQSYGSLHYVHNNAGIEYNRGFIVDCTEEEWMRVIDINTKNRRPALITNRITSSCFGTTLSSARK